VLVNFVKLAKIAISPVLGKGFAEFEVAFTNPSFQRHARLKISMSPRVMSQQLTASESKERGELIPMAARIPSVIGPQELSEPVNHFSRYIRRVPSRRRRFSQKGSGFVVRAQQLNCGVVINCPSNRNILEGSDVFLLRSQAAS